MFTIKHPKTHIFQNTVIRKHQQYFNFVNIYDFINILIRGCIVKDFILRPNDFANLKYTK